MGLKSLPTAVEEITVTVTRETESAGSETTIELTHANEADDIEEYTNEVVDPNHGWPGKTLKRGGNDDLSTPQEATVYTNIELAMQKKLTYGEADSTGRRLRAATLQHQSDRAGPRKTTILICQRKVRLGCLREQSAVNMVRLCVPIPPTSIVEKL